MQKDAKKGLSVALQPMVRTTAHAEDHSPTLFHSPPPNPSDCRPSSSSSKRNRSQFPISKTTRKSSENEKIPGNWRELSMDDEEHTRSASLQVRPSFEILSNKLEQFL
jgi:hypothetical protein